MAHEPFRGGKQGFSALPSMSMMGLMYKPDLTYLNSSDAAYKNAMARAKVLQSGNELHRHTYRGFSSRGMVGGDVYRGLSSGEATHVLKQFNTQQVDTDGMYEELPGDLSVAEMLMQRRNEPQSTESPTFPTLPSSTAVQNAVKLFVNGLDGDIRTFQLKNVPVTKLIAGVQEILANNPEDEDDLKEKIIYLLQDIAPDELFDQTDEINDLVSGLVQNSLVNTLVQVATNSLVAAFKALRPQGPPQLLNQTYQRNPAVYEPPLSEAPQPRIEAPAGAMRFGSPVEVTGTAPVGGPVRAIDFAPAPALPAPALPALPAPAPPFPDAVEPSRLISLYNNLPNVDKLWLATKVGLASGKDFAENKYSATWERVFDLRLKYLIDSPEFEREIRDFTYSPANQSPVYFNQFLRRLKEGTSMTRAGFGKNGGMSPGYSFFTDRPPVWGRRWRHYKPTYGQMTVAEQNKLFGKIYGSEREALRENENYRVRRREQDRKFRVQALRNDPNMRRWRTGRGKKVRKTKKVRRSVKDAATPKRRPSVRIEYLPQYEERTYYEDLPNDRPAIDYLVDSVRAQIQKKGGMRRRKVSRKYGGFVAPVAPPAVAPTMTPGVPTTSLSERLAAQRAKLLQQATPVATGGKRRRRYRGGARLIGGKLWIPNKSDPLYTM